MAHIKKCKNKYITIFVVFETVDIDQMLLRFYFSSVPYTYTCVLIIDQTKDDKMENHPGIGKTAVRARAELLAEQARAAQALAEEAQRQAGQLPEAPPPEAPASAPPVVSQSAQPPQPFQTETLPPHKRARKDS